MICYKFTLLNPTSGTGAAMELERNTAIMSDQYVQACGSAMKRPHPTGFTVTPNDVLGGRGLTIAQHPGNKAFRKLVARFTSSEGSFGIGSTRGE